MSAAAPPKGRDFAFLSKREPIVEPLAIGEDLLESIPAAKPVLSPAEQAIALRAAAMDETPRGGDADSPSKIEA